MASKPKSKPLTSSFIIFLIGLILFTIYYLRQINDDFQNAVTLHEQSKNPKWFDLVARELGDDKINVGLVNMEDRTEPSEEFPTKWKVVKVECGRAGEGLVWSDFFPEWVNENSTTSRCPELPMPEFGKYEGLDVVVARVPCNGCDESGWRDVWRLHVNLVVANLLVRSGGRRPVYAVFEGCCGPMWEIFRCEDLVFRAGGYSVYKPEMRKMKQKVRMPVGACQVSPPFAESGDELWRRQSNGTKPPPPPPREAYATVLHSSEAYVCGAIALAQSILQTNTTKDLILLADRHISPESISALRSSGWNKIKRIRRVRSPHSKNNSYNEWNYTKLRLWQLYNYDKVMFIDSDLIVSRSLDAFFLHPQLSAAPNDKYRFNSGLMLLEPSACTFRTLMRRRLLVKSYNAGDQGFLNEMFPWWHRLPKKVNRLKYFGTTEDREHRVVAGDMYALHYIGLKPWACSSREHDCNWNEERTRKYASNSANEMWWRVYDKMPAELRQFCEGRITKGRKRGS